MAKKIPVSNGKFYAIVDDEDYEFLSKWKWHLSANGKNVVHTFGKNQIGNSRKITKGIHSIINKTPKGFFTDHINGNPLDNRKINLRTVTPQQNQWNKRPGKKSKTGIKGVGWCKQTSRWKVSIFANEKSKTLGRFFCLGKAIKKYNNFAENYHGEYARLNKRST
jgi:hypothetical protein